MRSTICRLAYPIYNGVLYFNDAEDIVVFSILKYIVNSDNFLYCYGSRNPLVTFKEKVFKNNQFSKIKSFFLYILEQTQTMTFRVPL